MAEKTIASIQLGETKVFVAPSVFYVDIFSRPRRTTDCWAYDPKVADWAPCGIAQHHD